MNYTNKISQIKNLEDFKAFVRRVNGQDVLGLTETVDLQNKCALHMQESPEY